MMAAKLGLEALDRDGDDALLTDLVDLVQQVETGMRLFFRRLAALPVDGAADAADDAALVGVLQRSFYAEEAAQPEHRGRLAAWLRRYVARARQDGVDAAARQSGMNRVNPKYVLRNYLAQLA